VPERTVRLAVHCHQGSFPVWKLGPLVDDNLDPASLPISADLAAELTAWGRASPAAVTDAEAFLERGAALTSRLANELGPAYHVTFAGDQIPVQYLAVVDDRHPPERPTGLLRRTHTRPVATDEALHKDLQWHPTDHLRLYALGHYDHDLAEIPQAQAQAVIAGWRQLYSDPHRLLSVYSLSPPIPGQPPGFKVDGSRYRDTAAARAALEEASMQLRRRGVAFEVAIYPADPTDDRPVLPNWEEFGAQLGWRANAEEDQEARGP
jgi:hypothetical protein